MQVVGCSRIQSVTWCAEREREGGGGSMGASRQYRELGHGGTLEFGSHQSDSVWRAERTVKLLNIHNVQVYGRLVQRGQTLANCFIGNAEV